MPREAGSASPWTVLRAVVIRATVVAVAIAVTACAPTRADGPKVLLIGDSLLNASRSEVISRLTEDGWTPTIAAEGGTTITFWADRVQFFQDFGRPDIVVLELGTNDCSPVECPELAPYIDRVMQSIPTSHPVVWLNVQEDVPPPFDEDRDRVNAALESADVRWPNLSVVDLDGHFAGHPEWHSPDGLHFNDVGRREFASFLAEVLVDHQPA